ncbi:Clp1/GlmU family protein [Methanoculleus sp. MH98A]|uniref:Clp1/GlmU family protein n=1 Tax=Methanoculleus sp. MH98A TaxID=1495314 RepID=UPI0004A190F2|nr:polynucleotide 5'-hydroxyl-kinase [Methanoculleus sp. MH98A]KDE55875.1 ATPase AAA [Methanoculleus sp. MH98A]
MIDIGEGWEGLAAALRGSDVRERVYVVGSTDSGKTTLCRYLVDTTAAQTRTAYVDCDTGQSRIGPPTTEGMVLCSGPTFLRFVGSTSPGGHFVQTITGAKRLVEKAEELSARATVIDSPGLVSGGTGIEFQFQMIDLLRPTRIVALQRGRELERLLANFARRPGVAIHRIPVSPAVVARTATGRRRYREERFASYFAGAELQEIPLRGLGLQGRVPDMRNPRGSPGGWSPSTTPRTLLSPSASSKICTPEDGGSRSSPRPSTRPPSRRSGSVRYTWISGRFRGRWSRLGPESLTPGRARARPRTPPPGRG